MNKMGIDKNKLAVVLLKAYQKIDGFSELIDMQQIHSSSLISNYKALVENGYNPSRSGDFMLLLKPQWFIGYKTGTTHSTLYAYDTHVPLLFYGWKVQANEYTKRTSISDISTTLANWLKCMEPSGSIGSIIPFKL
jgi:hypothetical protein